jgi:hypothetical protein
MMKIAQTLVLILLIVAGFGCGYSKPAAMATTLPAISQLNPQSTSTGGAQFQLEVDGMNFSSSAMVNFNGAVQATTFVSATKLEATIPAAAIMNSGTVQVTVTNPGTGGIYGATATTSTGMSFMIN